MNDLQVFCCEFYDFWEHGEPLDAWIEKAVRAYMERDTTASESATRAYIQAWAEANRPADAPQRRSKRKARSIK
jgi:hypothetical protein